MPVSSIIDTTGGLPFPFSVTFDQPLQAVPVPDQDFTAIVAARDLQGFFASASGFVASGAFLDFGPAVGADRLNYNDANQALKNALGEAVVSFTIVPTVL